MSEEGSRGPSASSDDDPLLRAIARAPAQPLPAPVEDDVDPVRVAQFRIDGRLGAGGMGVVYRAYDEALRREVAVKLLPAVSAADPERRQRFLREARVAASLVHPNVAVVYQVGEADGRVYIAMELVEGQTLRARLAGGALSAATARDVGVQVAQGLGAAHAKGIVHRDLKPENVMVTSDGVVKLLDFGLAKSGWAHDSDSELARADTETQLTREGHVLGSSAYMSPEQALGMAVDARSDVFSYGIVLYEMLCGRRPFHGRTLGEMRAAIAREAPPPVDASVDAGLAAIVNKCLEKRAEDRYADAGLIALDLAADASASDRPRARAGELPAKRPPRGHVGWWGIAAAIAVAGGVLVATARHAQMVARAGEHAASITAPSSSSAVTAPYDDGANPSTNPDAQRAYEEALAAFHGGTGQTQRLLKKAAELDPGFGAAKLRLFVLNEGGWNLGLAAAVESEPTLSTRDRALLSAMDQGAEPAQAEQGIKLLDAYLAQHPLDEFAWQARVFLASGAGSEAYCDALERVVAQAPSFLTALAAYAWCRAPRQGSPGAAKALVDKCLASSARATDCLAVRVEIEERENDCAQLERDARTLVLLRPESEVARDGLANALAGTGAPLDTVREALGVEIGQREMILRAAFFPMFEGDFPEVARIGEEEMRSAMAARDVDRVVFAAHTLIDAYTESGDSVSAARVGRELARTARTLCDFGCLDDIAAGIGAMARGALLSRSKADAEEMDLYRKLARAKGAWDAWWWLYGINVRSTDDAKGAIAAYEDAGAPADERSKGIPLAVAYALAGRSAEARAIFERIGPVCRPVSAARMTMAEHLARGRVDEDAGDKPSACGHYAKVLERWGHAKPRSVTADEARARAASLGCPAP